MFGKVVGAAFFSLVAGGLLVIPADAQNDSQVTSEQHSQQLASNALPSEQVRSELAQQLLELALADIHPAFNELWLSLHQSHSQEQQAALYAQVYSILKQFRTQWHGLNWDARERLNLESIKLSTAVGLQKPYWRALADGTLAADVNAMRPAFREYDAMRAQLSTLLDTARAATWPEKLPAIKLHPGEEDPGLAQIKPLLLQLKLADALESGARYDDATVAAVELFQRQHGLLPDGVIGPRTLAWLQVSPAQKAVIVARSLLRRDMGAQTVTSRYVLVNIPEYRLRVLDGDDEVFTSRVIVGQLKRQTPLLASKIASVVLNPPWSVPASILKKDIVPKLAKDHQYLAKEKFEVYDYSGARIDPATIPWPQALQAGFPYKLQQKPGDHNALGRYKFYLPNDESVYLHSTSHPKLFEQNTRAISSGCVRVEQAADFATLLLKGSAWGPERVSKTIASDDTKWVKLSAPVPLFMTYWRAWVDEKGQLQLRDDIYGFDNVAGRGDQAVIDSVLSANHR